MRNKIVIFLSCGIISLLVLCVLVFQNGLFAAKAQQIQEEKKKTQKQDPIPSVQYDLVFDTNLPIIAIETDGEQIPYGSDVWSRVFVYDNPEGNNTVENEPDLCISSTIRYRGQSSAFFDKKSYSLEFYNKKDGNRKDISVLGMAEGHDWVLNGPYLDKSLMRNAFSYHVSREIMFYAPDTRYCEVYLNGEFAGLYLLVEKPRISETRINYSRTALVSGETAYLLQRNRPWEIRSYTRIVGEKLREPGPSGIDTNMDSLNTFGLRSGVVQSPLFVAYPNTERITAAQFQYIEDDISAFERALYSDFFLDPERGYRNYIDMDSFVEYYLIMEFSMNIDSGFLSTYVCKDLGGKLMMGPVWDFNNGYDNYVSNACGPEDGFVIADNNWYSRLLQDREFVDALIAKWQQLRQGILAEEAMLRYLDETEQYLGEAIMRNNQRWGYAFAKAMLIGDRDSFTYEEAREQFRDFLVRRGRYLDQNLDRLYLNCVN